MSLDAPQPAPSAQARRPERAALSAFLLCAALLLLPCAQAWAAGALPWLAPGQQANGTGTDANATAAAASPGPSAQPLDAAGLAQLEVLRQYFRRQITLDEDFTQVFSRRVRDAESLAFLAMREMQRRRGLLERFRAAQVDLEGLVFTRVTADPDLARIRVTGRYRFSVPPAEETVEEDALFVLLPEVGEWKIYERREGWRPYDSAP